MFTLMISLIISQATITGPEAGNLHRAIWRPHRTLTVAYQQPAQQHAPAPTTTPTPGTHDHRNPQHHQPPHTTPRQHDHNNPRHHQPPHSGPIYQPPRWQPYRPYVPYRQPYYYPPGYYRIQPYPYPIQQPRRYYYYRSYSF